MEGDDGGGGPEQPTRSQTDESLRVERDRADAGVAEKQATVEAKEDKVVRTARRLADQVVQDARNDADRAHPPSSDGAATVGRERDQADVVLADKRSVE